MWMSYLKDFEIQLLVKLRKIGETNDKIFKSFSYNFPILFSLNDRTKVRHNKDWLDYYIDVLLKREVWKTIHENIWCIWLLVYQNKRLNI